MLRAVPRHGLVGVFVTLAVLFCFLPVGNAQIDRGSLTGLVSDPTGAAVPGARIIVTEEATQVSFETTTGPTGMYVFPALKAGMYTLTVEMPGFERAIRRGIDIHVQDRVRVDVSLTLGAITTEVVVTGAAPLLDTQTAQMGKVVGSRETTELPLLNRKYADLALLTGGVVEAPSGLQNRGDSVFSADGNWATMNMFLLDGVDNNSFSTNLQERSAQAVQPSVEALAEFRVQTRTYDAEFGRNSGAVVNATLKSGTNEIHGSVFEFLRNDKLQANDWALNRAGEPKPGFKQNQFGFSLGGPLRRNTTFWFFNYEGTRMHRGVALSGSVPTPLMRTGDFTESPYDIYSPDPALVPSKAGCITDKVIDPACLDPVAVGLLELYPLPNFRRELEGIPGAYIGDNYYVASKWTEHSDSISGRVDHSFGNDHLFGHYSFWDFRRLHPSRFYDFNPIADGGSHVTGATNDNRGQHVALNWTHTFSPRVVNEFRAGYSRIGSHSLPLSFSEWGAAERYGIKGAPADNDWMGGGLPAIGTGWSSIGRGSYAPQWQVSWTYQFQDMVSVIFGNHNMKFGVEIRKDNLNYMDVAYPKGRIAFNGSYTAGRRFGGADFMLGLPYYARITTTPYVRQYWNAVSGFWQDQWRATPKLTLNYGVRYEYFTPPFERESHLSNFNPAGAGSVYQASTTGSVFDRTMFHPDRNNIAPRFSLAYSITPKLALRAGFGMFYQHQVRFGSEAQMGLNPPFLLDVRVYRTYPISEPPPILLEDGFPADFVPDPTAVDYSVIGLRARDPNMKTAYIEQGSLNLQYEFAPNFLLDVGYTGNAAHKLPLIVNLNQGYLATLGVGPPVFPYPDFLSVQWMTSQSNANYHSMQMKVRKRYSHGMAFTAAWTWGHWLGMSDAPLSGGIESPQNRYDTRDHYGPSNADVRHRFVMSYIYELPVGKGKNWEPTGVLGAVVGGWQANGIISFESGRPLRMSGGSDRTGTRGGGLRPDCVGDPYPPGFVKTEDAWFDTTAFARPAPYTWGNCGRGLIRGRGRANFNLSVFKRFSFTETRWLEFRMEVFNPFNSVRLGSPQTNVTSATFGRILSRVGDPREFQLALKFAF